MTNDAWMEVFLAAGVGDPVTLTGTVSVTAGTAAVVGVGTLFLSELSIGDSIVIGAGTHAVESITNNLNLVLTTNHVAGASGSAYSIIPQLQWNNAAYAYLGGLGHTSDSLPGRWATFWAGALP